MFFLALPDSGMLGNGQNPLGKDCADRGSRQRPHDTTMIGKGLFAESLSSGTWQPLCRGLNRLSAKKGRVTADRMTG